MPDAPLADLHRKLLDTEDLADFLHHMAGLAPAVLGSDVSCGITVIRDGQPATVASSDPRATAVDEIQYDLDDGPCLRAARTSQQVPIIDMRVAYEWGEFRPRALDAGVGSSLSMPLSTEVGALNLYFGEPAGFTTREKDAIERFAAESDRAIAVAVRLTQQLQVTRQLREALTSRSVIDQAIGMIMAERRCNPRVAFETLRKTSQDTNRKLRDVASDLVSQASDGVAGSRRA